MCRPIIGSRTVHACPCADVGEAGTGSYLCTPFSRLPSRPIVAGDLVRFIPAPDGAGEIIAVLPRRNQLARRAARLDEAWAAGRALDVDQAIAYALQADADNDRKITT